MGISMELLNAFHEYTRQQMATQIFGMGLREVQLKLRRFSLNVNRECLEKPGQDK
jgi:hypothetical protein